MAIKIILSAANMGSLADEADFDAWASYVCDNVDEACGVFVAEVDQQRFGDAGPDRVTGATEEQRATILGWLAHEGWEAFCADSTAWPTHPETDLCPVAVGF
jgi:hypothetical protein